MESAQNERLIHTIQEWFGYDHVRGIIIRKIKTRSDAYDEIGYRQTVHFQGKHYPYASLCWIIYYGKWPKGWVDHKDRIKAHNWITNLREATPSQNQQNKAGTGTYPKGVAWRDRKVKPWVARIRVPSRRINLGSFATMEEAAEAYRQACIEYHGEFACVE